MIVFPHPLLLSATLSEPLTHARIGWDTYTLGATDANVTASSETAAGPKDAPLRADTVEFWEPSSLPATWDIDFGSILDLDYVGIVGSLGSNGCAVEARISQDVADFNDYLSLSGDDANYASTPDSAAVSITGDLQLDLEFSGAIAGAVDSDTAQGGSASTLQLQAGASATDDAYNGMIARLLDGTLRERKIADYAGATKVATMTTDWPAGWLFLPGTAGNRASTPDSAANSVTGDIDIRVKLSLVDWTPSSIQPLVSKFDSAGQRSYELHIHTSPAGTPRLKISNDGTTIANVQATTTVGFTDGTVHWVRATCDVDNGASGFDVKFYTSDDYDPDTELGTWTQLGSTVTTATATSIFDGNSTVKIGRTEFGTTNTTGNIYYAEVRNGINGTLALRFDPRDAALGASSFVSAKTGATWTISTSGSPVAELAGAPSSSTDYEVFRNRVLAAKWVESGNQRAYKLFHEADESLLLKVSTAGTAATVHAYQSDPIPFTLSQRGRVRVKLDLDDGAGHSQCTFETSDDDGETWDALGSAVAGPVLSGIYDSTSAVELGSSDGGVTQFSGFIFQFWLYDGIDGSPVAHFDASEGDTGDTSIVSEDTGETWTIHSTGPATALTIKRFSTPVAPGDDAPIMMLDELKSARRLRLTFTGTTAPRIAVVYAGPVLAMQRAIRGGGHVPITMARETVLKQPLSRGGQFLGQSFRRMGVAGSVSFQLLEPAWVRANFDPFAKAARNRPYFYAWRPATYPLECGFCWATDDIKPSMQGIYNFMQVSWNMQGVGSE